jgi:hypothetical protein
LLRFPEQRFSAICLCNDEAANPTALALRIADIYLADRFENAPNRPVVAQRDGGPAAPAAELAARAGVYREPVTHAVARVTADGPGLLVDQGWGPSAYAPIGRDAFRSADRDVGFTADLVFAKEKPAVPERFQLLQFAELPLNFERIDPHSPSPDELEEYTGIYTSKELETTHRIYLKDGHLYLIYRRSPQTPLQPTLKDQFTLGAMSVEFARDSRGDISGYGIWYDWAWNVRFTRRDP